LTDNDVDDTAVVFLDLLDEKGFTLLVRIGRT